MSTDSPDAPHGYTDNERVIPGGFTGTIPVFLEWLEEQLAYGAVSIGDPEPAELFPERLVRRVSLVTGGYSDDEALLGRVEHGSLFSLSYWESSHRGGLTVYEVPVERFDSLEEHEWLEPPTDVFEKIHRARTLIVRTSVSSASGSSTEMQIEVPYGVQLSFSEPNRDIVEPAGVLTIEPIPKSESIWGQFEQS